MGSKGIKINTCGVLTVVVCLLLIHNHCKAVSDGVSTVTGDDSSGNKDVYLQVEKYVRLTLFPKIKFTTDTNTLYKQGQLYVLVVRDLRLNNNMGAETWKKFESVIRRSFNNKRNNTVETMKHAFKCKYYSIVRCAE